MGRESGNGHRIKYRMDRLIKQGQTALPTSWGNFTMIAYAVNAKETMPHLAMVHEDFNADSPVYLRIHSECLTGDLFHSHRCDCGEQLDRAMQVAAEKGGVVLYLRQEGRGIGLINKIKAYNLQDQGLNTAEANSHLGLEVDARHYDIALQMMADLKIDKIHLLTNNPLKVAAVESSSVTVMSRIPLVIASRAENFNYLKTKKDLMGHFLEEGSE